MNLYIKARKYIDMNRVKKLHEEKIKRKKIADDIREQIREELRNLNSPEFSNWRYEIDEGMTTSDLFSTTLPAQGDVSLADITSPILPGSSPGGSQNGNTYIAGPPSGGGSGDEVNGGFIVNVNSYEYDTIVFDLTAGNINKFAILSLSGNNTYDLSISSGRKVVTLNKSDMKKSIDFAFSFYNFSGADYGTNIISNLSFQRRTPINVFVSLDSPEASAFIRTDPVMKGLSAEGRKKKLLDMLNAGDEYLLQQLGITGSAARPSDITMPNSWEVAGTGPKGMDRKPGSYDPRNIIPIRTPGSNYRDGEGYELIDPFKNSPATGPGLSNQGKDDTQIAQVSPDGERKIDDMLLRGLQRGDYGTGPNIQRQIDNLKKNMRNNAPGGGGFELTHYEPEGEVLSEKKRFKSPKDITSKIPGYYDGKPAPLGFPMQEPPKIVNGFHPDLVTPEGQKKQAKRYNRLDPQSARAMPPTANPYIDKIVRAAAKKPK
jgi:hypothetical protein